MTGATGFVGPHLARHLAAAGDAVVAAGPRELDVSDPSACRKAVAEAAPDVVYHLAGISHVEGSAEATYRVNALGTLHVLDAVRREAPRATAVLASSAYVYGAVPAAEQPIPEARPVRPTSHYGASKAAMEAVASVFAAQGLRVVVARAFNHVGAGQSTSFVVPAIARQVAGLAAGRLEGAVRLGNSEAVRDLLDVRDVCAAYRLLAEKAPAGAVVNVGSGVGVRVGDVAQRLLALAGVEAPVEVDASRLRGSGEIDALVADNRRLRALGWAPKHGLDHALVDVLAEWKERWSQGEV